MKKLFKKIWNFIKTEANKPIEQKNFYCPYCQGKHDINSQVFLEINLEIRKNISSLGRRTEGYPSILIFFCNSCKKFFQLNRRVYFDPSYAVIKTTKKMEQPKNFSIQIS